MNPRDYEQQVAVYFQSQGYQVELIPPTNDWGVDVFASRNSEKLAIQVKMYGHTRKVNRDMIMHLYAAKDCSNCNGAVIVTDGELTNDALEAAERLRVQVLFLPRNTGESSNIESTSPTEQYEFWNIWNTYIRPLEGKQISLQGHKDKCNFIKKVDDTGIERETSNKKARRIDIDIFKKVINAVLAEGEITRDEINQEYVKRASSGIVAVLAQVPLFEVVDKPVLLVRLRNKS